jgi:4'-phosphopantetheinyl transferase
MAPAQVDVWWLHSARGNVEAGSLEPLDDAEKARARRFRFQQDRVRFVDRHVFVRRVLASYLDVEPGDVTIRISPYGRPQLDRSTGFGFSVSHSDELAVLAVARTHGVGIDIERVRPTDGELEIAATMFTKPELTLLRTAAPDSRAQLFLELWTRKESLVKAIGRGLSLRLDSFSVVDGDGRWFTRPRGPSGALPFAIDSLVAPPGYVGAVAIAAERFDIVDRGIG